MSAPERVVTRLLTNIAVADDGCWISLYSTGSHGYSQIGWVEDGRLRMALGHRVSWEHHNGPIPGDLTIDHLCRTRRCIRPDHLRLLSNVENARDNGMARRTHCPRGHLYAGHNLILNAKGHRLCRTCRDERNARRFIKPGV